METNKSSKKYIKSNTRVKLEDMFTSTGSKSKASNQKVMVKQVRPWVKFTFAGASAMTLVALYANIIHQPKPHVVKFDLEIIDKYA